MSKLKAVAPEGAKQKKPKILIFGKPGVGKTYNSLDFPRPYYIDTENGASLSAYIKKLKKSNGAYLGPEEGSLDFEVLISQIKALTIEDHPYQTLVIDSLSKIFNSYVSDEAERLGSKDAFGASKKPAVAYMRRIINWISRIDMNVILICHEKNEWGLNGSGERVEIGSTFDCWEKLGYELDLSLEILKAGPARKAKIKKSRLEEFPETDIFDWSYDNFASKYGKMIIEAPCSKIILATKEQVAEIKNLLEIIKTPEGQEEKWLKSCQVDSWEEMSTDTIKKFIDQINKIYLNKEVKNA